MAPDDRVGPRISRRELGGVPFFQVEAEGLAQAGLIFRVGFGDEPAPRAGITHLVEHLTLFRCGQRPYAYNGMVDPIRTTFIAGGRPDEVARHLAEVIENIASLPLDRLIAEGRILRDERTRRGLGPVDMHAWLRWGAAGPGISTLREIGLYAIDAEALAAWSRDYFTAGNAALVWSGPEPPELAISLPAGVRRAPPQLEALVDQPVWSVGPPGGISLSCTVPRRSAASAMQRILAKRLQQRLRYDRGLSYDISAAYQPLTAETAASTIWATTGAGDAAIVRDLVIGTIDDLRDNGPSAEELALELDGLERSRTVPQAPLAEADRRAVQELLGAAPERYEDLHAELAAVTQEAGRSAFQESVTRLIVVQPGGVRPPPSWIRSYPQFTKGRLPGQAFRQRRQSQLPWATKLPQLVVGADGVAVVGQGDDAIHIRYADAAFGIIKSERAAAIQHRSGSEIVVEASAWRDGAKAIELISERLPRDKLIRVDPADQSWPTWAPPNPRARASPGRSPLALLRRWDVRVGIWLVLVLLTIGLRIAQSSAPAPVGGPGAGPVFQGLSPSSAVTLPPLGAVIFGSSAQSACLLGGVAGSFPDGTSVYWVARSSTELVPYETVRIMLKASGAVIEQWEEREPSSVICSSTPVAGLSPGVYRVEIEDVLEEKVYASGYFAIY